ATHFIKELNARHGKHVTGIAEPVRKAVAAYDWPGNVRELRNLIESMLVQDQDGVLGLDDVQEGDSLHRLQFPDYQPAGPAGLVGRRLTEIEYYFIEQTLQLTEGNREEAARLLGIGERTLYRIMQDWKLRERIRLALEEAQGNTAEAAKRLNMKEPVLSRK